MPIISLCLDDRQRKFFVGDALGGITCHNYLNGVQMKRFEAHTSQVRGLVSHREMKRFEAHTSQVRGLVSHRVMKRFEAHTSQVRHTFEAHTSQVTCLMYVDVCMWCLMYVDLAMCRVSCM